MTDTIDAEIEADLAALSDGNLDAERAIAVADYLAERPERAAAVLADARTVGGLRLALNAVTEPSPAHLVSEARRLEGRLRRRRMVRRVAPFAAAVALFGAGWVGHLAWQSTNRPEPPGLVQAALDAQAALTLRHQMASQPESADLNTQEILAALGISVPAWPDGWAVRDVQVVSSPGRPAIAIALDAPDLGPVLLFAISRSPGDVTDPPAAFEYEGRSVAVFERGHAAYVLVDSSGHPEQLSAGADLLMSRLQ